MKPISANEWLEFAGTYKDKIVKEIKYLARDIVAKIAEAPIFAHRDQLIHETRTNLDHLLYTLREGAMSFLRIPTRKDLSTVQRRLAKMESRLSALDKTERSPPAHT